MSNQSHGRACGLPQSGAIVQAEAYVRDQLHGRVRGFSLLVQDSGLVLRGHAHTYYVKQLAQHVVMQATGLPILANNIEVSRAST